MISARFAAAAIILQFASATAAEPLDALMSAVALAEAHKADRYAFTAAFTDLEGEAGRMIEVRFDPRLPAGARWTLLSPTESALTKKERERFRSLSKENDADGGLVYDGLASSIGAAELLSTDEDSAIFAAPIRGEDAPKSAREAVEMRLVVDLEDAFVRSIELTARKPFKPAPVAIVRRMSQVQTYEAPASGAPALLSRSQSHVEGEAMFKSFVRRSRIEYRDFELVSTGSADDAGE